MSFLAPLFLIGALAISAPIVFHLIRRSSRDRMPFSSLMFLRATIPRVTRQSRLENLLLLLLRCLILLLLAFGFARPFVQKPILPELNANLPKKIALLLDTSASMQRENLWTDALDRARDVLGEIDSSDIASVGTFDRKVKQLVTFDEWTAMAPEDRVTISLQRLEASKPGWSSTDLANGLITTAELFDDNPTQDHLYGIRRIVFISDLQEGAKTAGLQGYEWPRGIECVAEALTVSKPSNAGFQVVIDSEGALELSTNSPPRLRVMNSADSASDQFQVRWATPTESTNLNVYVPAGSSRVLSAPTLPEGGFGERLALNGDGTEFDNSVYYVPQKAESVPVMYIGNEDPADSEQPLYYLKRAFQQTRRHVVTLHQHPISGSLPKSETDAAKLVVVTDTLPDSQVNQLKTLLESGSTVLLVLRSINTAATLGALLNTPSLSATEIASKRYAMLGEIHFEHPLFAPFADPRFSDFTRIHFWKHRQLQIENLPNLKTIAAFDDGSPALIEASVGKGTLLALTSCWQPSDSQLALSSKFVPLLYSILDQAAGLKSHRFQYWVGDSVSLGNTNSLQTATIRKPDGTEIQAGPGEAFSETDIPGIYTVLSTTPPWRFAVNLDPAESRTAPLAPEDLERFGVPFPKMVTAAKLANSEARRTEQHATELESQQKLWRWIILVAAIAVAIETFFAGWISRRVVPAS